MIYDIADQRIDIRNKFDFTTKFCRAYLSDDQSSHSDVTVELTKAEFDEEKEKSEGYSDGYIENIAIYRKLCHQLVSLNRFLFHGVVLEYKGVAYLFTGRSGKGKSTHASLWTNYVEGASVLNGDKPIVAVEGDKLIAYGTPWNGKEGLGTKGKAEIKAICFIEQAKRNYVERMTPSECSELIFRQLLIPKETDGVIKTFEFAEKLLQLPVYRLFCDISEEAVRVAYRALIGGEL